MGRQRLIDRIALLVRAGEGLLAEFKERYTSRIDEDIFETGGFFRTVLCRSPEFALAAPGTRVKTVEETVEETVIRAQGLLLELIRRDPTITGARMAKSTGLSRRGIEWNLDALKRQGVLKRVGPTKGGHWEVLTPPSDPPAAPQPQPPGS